MRTMKKIISAFLVFSLLTVGLCSCNLFANPEELITEAETALADKSYTVELAIKYESEDEKMKEAIAAFTNPHILTEVNGDDFRITMTFEKDGRENGVIYTYVDGTLYTILDELGVTTKTSEVIDELDKKAITDSLGQGASIGIEDFESVKAVAKSGTGVITCTQIKDEPLEALGEALADDMPADTVVAIKDVILAIQLNGGLYDVTLLTCEYVITTPDSVYTLTMTYASKFTYGDVDEIVAPTF